MADIARQLFGEWVVGCWVTADGFKPNVVGRNMVGNVAGLLFETQHLLAAEESGSQVPVAKKRLPSSQRTAKGLFIFGKQNGEIVLDGPGAVEKTVGEVLSSVASDDMVRFDLINYAITNRVMLMDSWESVVGRHAFFRSMGFGRLELGRTRFGRYVVDRLVGLTGRRLRSADVVDWQRTDDEQPDDTIKRLAAQMRYQAAERAGLHEFDITTDDQHDQILDALRPDAIDGHSTQAADASGGSGKIDDTEMMARLKTWVEDRTKKDAGVWQGQLLDNIGAWVAEVERRFVNTVVWLVANYGVPVTTRVLALIKDDLKEAATQLQNDAKSVSSQLAPDTVVGHVRQTLGDFSGVLSTDLRAKAAKKASKILAGRFEGWAREAAADACEAAAEYLVEPVRRSLSQLEGQLTDVDGEWERVLGVLPWEGGSAGYQPNPYEVVIEIQPCPRPPPPTIDVAITTSGLFESSSILVSRRRCSSNAAVNSPTRFMDFWAKSDEYASVRASSILLRPPNANSPPTARH